MANFSFQHRLPHWLHVSFLLAHPHHFPIGKRCGSKHSTGETQLQPSWRERTPALNLMVSRQTRCHTSTETVPQAPQRTGSFKLQQENYLDWSAQSSDIPQSPTLNWNTCTCSYRQSPDAKPELVQSHRLKGVCPAHRNPQRSLCTNSRTCTQNTLSLASAPALLPVLRHDLPQILRLSILAKSIPAIIHNK